MCAWLCYSKLLSSASFSSKEKGGAQIRGCKSPLLLLREGDLGDELGLVIKFHQPFLDL